MLKVMYWRFPNITLSAHQSLTQNCFQRQELQTQSSCINNEPSPVASSGLIAEGTVSGKELSTQMILCMKYKTEP
jgi:hypothetical protein